MEEFKELFEKGNNRILVNYNNIYHSYQIELINLKLLEEEKEEIRKKYFKTTSSPENSSSNGNSNDKYELYMINLDKKKTLDKIQVQRNIVNRLKYYLNKINYHLSKLEGIEYRLYYKIINGINVSRAIEEIVSENIINNEKPEDSRIIWKKYYPNIKKDVENFYKIQDQIQEFYTIKKARVQWKYSKSCDNMYNRAKH